MSSPEFWIFPIAILGACVGSFLNVVIYRLPRGLSVAQPRWSFCPQCEHRIRPYDNIPIFGWLLLRGRCRDCRLTIASMYPVVEAMTALLFVAVWDALFIARVVSTGPMPPTVATGWPMAVSLLFLFSGLIAMSVMDLESYTVDIRICVAGVVVGVLAHAAGGWLAESPAGAFMQSRSDTLPPAMVLASVAAGAAWALWVFVASQLDGDENASAPPTDNSTQAADDAVPESVAPAASAPAEPSTVAADTGGSVGVVLLAIVIAAMSLWVTSHADWPRVTALSAGQLRGVIALFVFMTVLICASIVPREADDAVFNEIEAQRGDARSMALRELAGFLPSLIGAAVVIWWLQREDLLAKDWTSYSRVPFSASGGSAAAAWSLGMNSLAAAVLAAALGWTVRILGTLAFGKEAFGTGDIYILAAIGAAAGLEIAVLGFFVAAFLALAGVAIMLVRKRARAVPFGPWLALGAFLALYLRPPLMNALAPVLRFIWGRCVGLPADIF